MTVGNDKPVYRCDSSLEAGVLMDNPLPPSPVGRLRGVAPERGTGSLQRLPEPARLMALVGRIWTQG